MWSVKSNSGPELAATVRSLSTSIPGKTVLAEPIRAAHCPVLSTKNVSDTRLIDKPEITALPQTGCEILGASPLCASVSPPVEEMAARTK